MKEIIVIAGPTASGKSRLAIELAEQFNGEIISADSRTIYREMDVATSKPTIFERNEIPHHLFDIVRPEDPFSVALYKKLAIEKIGDVQERNKTPFLVGGTGLYIDSVVYDFSLAPGKPDSPLKQKLEDMPSDKLFEKLMELDPVSAKEIGPSNKRRLARALEVSLATGKPFSSQKQRKELPKNILYLAIDVPREELYARINTRIDGWLETGLIEETRNLAKKYPPDIPSMSAIGYKEMADYLAGNIDKEKAVKTMKQRTRNYAKRQLTWFRKNDDIVWIKGKKDAEDEIRKFSKRLSNKT